VDPDVAAEVLISESIRSDQQVNQLVVAGVEDCQSVVRGHRGSVERAFR